MIHCFPLDFCVGKEPNSYHRYPDNCQKFVICVQELNFPMDCPSALHFSLEEKMCNLKEVAGCESEYHEISNISKSLEHQITRTFSNWNPGVRIVIFYLLAQTVIVLATLT